MHLGKLFVFGLMAAALPAFAEEATDRKTATSLKYVTHELETRQNKFDADTNKAMEYTNAAGVVQKRAVTSDLDNGGTESIPMVGGVNTKLNQKQDDIDPVNDHTAVTYTGTAGTIGQKGIYQTSESYAAQSDNLIDAKTFNAALRKGLDSEFICSESDPNTNLCWVYSIHNVITDNGVLPNDYTPLEWIESDGHQYIDTEISPNQNTKVKGKFAIIDTSANRSYIIGVTNRGSGRFQFSYSTEAFFGFGQAFIKPTLTVNTDIHRFTADKNAFIIDGVTVYIPTNNDFSGDATMYLFANNDLTINAYSVKIYELSIYNGDTLVRNFIPAQHGDAVGMYDTVSRRFFTSSAPNTNFSAGPVANTNIYIPQDQQ